MEVKCLLGDATLDFIRKNVCFVFFLLLLFFFVCGCYWRKFAGRVPTLAHASLAQAGAAV